MGPVLPQRTRPRSSVPIPQRPRRGRGRHYPRFKNAVCSSLNSSAQINAVASQATSPDRQFHPPRQFVYNRCSHNRMSPALACTKSGCGERARRRAQSRLAHFIMRAVRSCCGSPRSCAQSRLGPHHSPCAPGLLVADVE